MRIVKLTTVSGSLAGRSFELKGGPLFIFGRSSKAHVSLAGDPSASQLHFAVDVSGETVRVTDLGSTNGLIVNDVLYGGKFGKITTDFIPVHNGDTVIAGGNHFRVEIGDSNGDGEPLKTDTSLAFARAAKELFPDHSETIQRGRDGEVARADAGVEADATIAKNAAELDSSDIPVVAGYTILNRIGSGGRGVVFKAIRDQNGEKVAIKIMLGRTAKKRRAMEIFRREIQITKQLSHPNIIRYVGDGMAGDLPYLAIEYVSGGNLDQHLSGLPNKQMPFARAVPLFVQLLEATSYMHHQGMVHKDIKPKNILLDLRRGGGMAVKLSDMGLSSRAATQDESFLPAMNEGGTPAYMPPEQLTDITKSLPQSDVFSAAATMYQMLSGRLLYDFKDRDQVATILDGNIVPILTLCPDLPGRFAEVINKALAYYPEARYADAEEMLAALRAALQ